MTTYTTGNETPFSDYLKNLPVDNENTIQAAVIKAALEYDEPKAFFEDIFEHGCMSGMIPSLIHYKDTHCFYDTHYDEIEQLRENYEENTGTPIPVKGDLKNFFAWFAFEQVAYNIYQQWEQGL